MRSNEEGLWVRSAAWRWTFVLTCLATAMVVLLGPWNRDIKVSPTNATFTQPQSQPPPVSQSQINLTNTATPTPASASGGSVDSTFNVNIIPLAASFPAGTELHMIGVYEGALLDGQVDKPWWANCTNLGDPQSGLECHSKYAGKPHTEKTVTVNISKTSAPIVLALMSYEPEKWKIIAEKGVNIQKVILSGYHGQDIEGIPNNIPVDLYAYDSSNCKLCTRQSGFFYTYEKNSAEYNKVVNKLYSLTGLTPSTFQGAYRSGQFYISNSTSLISKGATHINYPSDKKDYITDKTFVDRLSIGGKNVPLPEGHWLGVAYAVTGSSRGDDELAILARIENKQLIELIAVRLQAANDGNGFPSNMNCLKSGLHAKKIEANTTYGTQLCYWVNYNTDTWKEGIFSMADNRLASLGITTPNLLVNSGFHKAGQTLALTAFYFVNPEIKGIYTSKTTWEASQWHPNRIKENPDKDAFIKERIRWSDSWFQIFNVTADL
jgi:hypothetical protein